MVDIINKNEDIEKRSVNTSYKDSYLNPFILMLTGHDTIDVINDAIESKISQVID